MQPVAYYAPETGAGRAIRFFLDKPDLRIGVVGLGAGTLAAYPTRPTQFIEFYEINPEVVTIANKYFTFLKECKGRQKVVLGDARLSMKSELERGDRQNFDVLVLDAFSGDAPPAHLLTREAFALYREHMRKDGRGIIAVNIKNRYVHLAPVVKAAADYWGFRTTRIWTDENKARLMYEVDYMLLTEKNDDFLAANPPVLAPGVSPEIEPAPWTDHYNNLFQLLMRK
jgi:spermidine synthase